jgi:hypothetical protein
MGSRIGIIFLLGAGLGLFVGSPRLSAQACKDEEAMAGEYKKSMAELVVTVRKESLADFGKAFHQKGTLNKLTLYGTMVDGVLTCLERAAQDTAAPKEEVEASKAKYATYVKLKEKIQHDRNALKAAEAPKDAKALIEKLDLAG